MKISVILPVYNEAKYIEACLKSICNQTVKSHEIIVIDDGSTDGSVSSIPAKQDLALPDKTKIKILKQKHQGVAKARNFGAKQAEGDILVFLDADMVYDKNYIRELVQPLTHANEIATTSGSEYSANLNNIWAMFWDRVTFNNRGNRIILTNDRDGTFRAIKAEYFRNAGGYDNFGASDDTSVLTKLKRTAKCMSTAVCYHYNPSTLTEVFFSARWMGRDKGNKNQFIKLLIFSPLWSVFKAIRGCFRYRDGRFLPFRLVFDWGYFSGLIDVIFKNIHYK